MTAETGRAAESTDDVEQAVQRFLAARTRTTWEPDRDLFTGGGLSSLFAMELVVHLEQTFGVVIAGTDLRLDNFRTVHAMTALVRRLRAGGGGD
ncbi:acyl carrier protein [Amycolatopsis minnesotensis]|uniref:Carrier domain-containing protein n=1 Tax=Amycolatopsis minnesotensis TaxID=337894 RepID=A0ABP5C844_9PSEU